MFVTTRKRYERHVCKLLEMTLQKINLCNAAREKASERDAIKLDSDLVKTEIAREHLEAALSLIGERRLAKETIDMHIRLAFRILLR